MNGKNKFGKYIFLFCFLCGPPRHVFCEESESSSIDPLDDIEHLSLELDDKALLRDGWSLTNYMNQHFRDPDTNKLNFDPNSRRNKSKDSVEIGLTLQIANVLRLLDSGFSGINNRINELEKKIGEVKEEVTSLKSHIDNGDERLDKLQNIVINTNELIKQLLEQSKPSKTSKRNVIEIINDSGVATEIPKEPHKMHVSDLIDRRIEEKFSVIDYQVNKTIERVITLRLGSENGECKIVKSQMNKVDEILSKTKYTYNFVQENMLQKDQFVDEISSLKSIRVSDKKTVETIEKLLKNYFTKMILTQKSLFVYLQNISFSFTSFHKPEVNQTLQNSNNTISTITSVFKPNFLRNVSLQNEDCSKLFRGFARSCADIYDQNKQMCDGVYSVTHSKADIYIVNAVYCSDMQPYENFTRGWTVILRRSQNDQCPLNNSLCFMLMSTTFKQYVEGFGNPKQGKYFLGLENVHQFTKDSPHLLQIDLEAENGDWASFRYRNFRLGRAPNFYFLFDTIEILTPKEGNLPEESYLQVSQALMSLNGSIFMSRESSNTELEPVKDCLKLYYSDWWIREDKFIGKKPLNCTTLVDVNLFAPFSTENSRQHIYWNDWASQTGKDRKVKSVIMKVRPI